MQKWGLVLYPKRLEMFSSLLLDLEDVVFVSRYNSFLEICAYFWKKERFKSFSLCQSLIYSKAWTDCKNVFFRFNFLSFSEVTESAFPFFAAHFSFSLNSNSHRSRRLIFIVRPTKINLNRLTAINWLLSFAEQEDGRRSQSRWWYSSLRCGESFEGESKIARRCSRKTCKSWAKNHSTWGTVIKNLLIS